MDFKKLDNLMEEFVLCEDEENSVIKIFFSDLDLDARKRVLEAIDGTSDMFDVFSDDIVRNKLEDELSTKPLLMTTALELMSKLNIEVWFISYLNK